MIGVWNRLRASFRGETRRISRSRARRLRRRRGRLTREGKAFVLLTVGVGVAAVNTGNNLLYLALGLLLSLLLVSMVLSEVALFGLRLTRAFPRRGFAKAPVPIEVAVANKKRWMPSYSLEVRDVAGEESAASAPCFLIKIRPQDTEVGLYEHVPSHRGYQRWSGFRVTTRYPFGLVEKDHYHREEDSFLVYPTLTSGSAQLERSLAGDDATTAQSRGRGDELDGLREYVEGDGARDVHWQRSATLGYLVVKRRALDSSRRFSVVLDNGRPDGAGPEWNDALERAIEQAAGLARDATRSGAAVDIVARGGRSPVVTAGAPCDPLWRFLALLEPVATDVPLASVDRGSVALPIEL